MTLKIVSIMLTHPSVDRSPFCCPVALLRRSAIRRRRKDRHHAVRRGHLQQHRLHGEGGLQQPGKRQPAHPLRHLPDTPVQQLPRAGGGPARPPLEGVSPSPAGDSKPGLLTHRQTPWQR